MKTYNDLWVTIHYHVSGSSGESAKEAVVNSLDGYDGEITGLSITAGEDDFEEDDGELL